MSGLISFERYHGAVTSQRTTVYPGGTDSVFARLPHCDLLTFLAIVQTIAPEKIQNLDIIPRFESVDIRRGMSASVHTFSAPDAQNVVYKRTHVTRQQSQDKAFRALICELLILEHPVLKRTPSIQKITAIAWDVQYSGGNFCRVMPVFVFKNADHGTLAEYTQSDVSLIQRLKLCEDIGKAIRLMHSFKIVHGDIKPRNILVFEEAGRVQAKVIDFGCSCFGSSDSDEVVLRGTPGWRAPEVGDGLLNIRTAKKADVYSFGKVCAYVILGFGIEDIPSLSSEADIDQILENAKQRSRTHWRNNFRLEEEFFVSLGLLLRQACHDRASQRPDIVCILDGITSLIELYRAADVLPLPRRLFKLPELTHASLIRRLLHRLDMILGRLFVKAVFGSNSRLFIPGQPTLVWDWLGLQVILACLCIFAGCYYAAWVLFSYYYSRTTELVPWMIFYVALPFVASGLLVNLFSHTSFGDEVQRSFRSIHIYGQIEHAVPRVSRSFSWLNRSHFLVREQLLRDLERRARPEHGCSSCQKESAFQLALIYETALGTARDTNESRRWLRISDKGEKDLKAAFREIQYDIDHHLVAQSFRLGGSDFESLKQDISIPLAEQYCRSNLIKKAISHYETEIQGRQACEVGTETLPLLHACLASLSIHCCEFEKAERYWLEAARLDNPTRRMKFFSKWVTPEVKENLYAEQLTTVYIHQRNQQQAINTLSGIKMIKNSPNGYQPFYHPVKSPHRRQFSARALLCYLLVQKCRFDEVLNLDLVKDLSDAIDCLGFRHVLLGNMSLNILQLARGLGDSGRPFEAFNLLHRFLQLSKDRFGPFDATTVHVAHNLTFVATQIGGPAAEIATSLEIPWQSLTNWEISCHMTLQIIVRSLAFRKLGNLAEAKTDLEQAIKLFEERWTLPGLARISCWNDFETTVTLNGSVDQELLMAMPVELLRIAVRISYSELHETLIRLIYEIFETKELRRATELSKCVLDEVQENNALVEQTDLLTVQIFHAFMLSCNGLLYEDLDQIENSLGICRDICDIVARPNHSRRWPMCLLASIYSKKSLVSLNHYGFRAQDVAWMQEAEDLHLSLVDEMTRDSSSLNTRTMDDAKKDLAVLLSRHGLHQDDEVKLNKANEMLDEMIKESLKLIRSEFEGQEVSIIAVYRMMQYLKARFEHLEAFTDPFESNEQHSPRKHTLQSLVTDFLYDCGKGDPCSIALQEHFARLKMSLRHYEEARILITDAINDFRKWRPRVTPFEAYTHPRMISLLEAKAQILRLDGNQDQAISTLKYVISLARHTFPNGDEHPRTRRYRKALTSMTQDGLEEIVAREL